MNSRIFSRINQAVAKKKFSNISKTEKCDLDPFEIALGAGAFIGAAVCSGVVYDNNTSTTSNIAKCLTAGAVGGVVGYYAAPLPLFAAAAVICNPGLAIGGAAGIAIGAGAMSMFSKPKSTPQHSNVTNVEIKPELTTSTYRR
jgi:hypothetical protein